MTPYTPFTMKSPKAERLRGPKRFCARCGKEMRRMWYMGKLETPSKFLERKRCSPPCWR